MEYLEREELKREAWRQYASKTTSTYQKAYAILEIIRAHYWRAREGLEARTVTKQKIIHGKRYCKGYQLDIDVYTKHWLFANGEKLVSKDVLNCIKDSFGYEPVKSKYLPPGFTSYVLPSEAEF